MFDFKGFALGLAPKLINLRSDFTTSDKVGLARLCRKLAIVGGRKARFWLRKLKRASHRVRTARQCKDKVISHLSLCLEVTKKAEASLKRKGVENEKVAWYWEAGKRRTDRIARFAAVYSPGCLGPCIFLEGLATGEYSADAYLSVVRFACTYLLMITILRRLFPFLRPRRSAAKVKVERLLGESIRNLPLYEQALRHRSSMTQYSGGRLLSNERLEFLGDAVVDLVVAEFLYDAFPNEMEGFLTLMRVKFVRGSALAAVARSLDLGTVLEMSSRAAQQGSRNQDAVLADGLEALIGALYLDRGLPIARRFIHRTMLEGVDLEALAARQDNFKSLLLQYTQARGWPHPAYAVEETIGPPHAREFKVSVKVEDKVRGEGRASSKKKAEQLASRAALWKLENREAKKAKKENYKGRLLELVQARRWPKPEYKVVHRQGPPHAPLFTVEVRVGTMAHAKQQAGSKKGAEHRAARDVLEQLLLRTAPIADR